MRHTVHPRVGGEHCRATRTPHSSAGSSPRGRGTPCDMSHQPRHFRFIPAWAGNTSARGRDRAVLPVHPRVGGEHGSPGRGEYRCAGSSPRGRGTPARAPGRRASGRFIPAWAGNTHRGRAVRAAPPVHPRVGGEHITPFGSYDEVVGSSPRGRGTPYRYLSPYVSLRFIPAWAGNTRAGIRRAPVITVHPRVGGEHNSVIPDAEALTGSSPRGRGTQKADRLARHCDRFIPAWAGNTPHGASPPLSCAGSSPRGRGTQRRPAEDENTPGSSPRGRGTQQDNREGARVQRFIPAWAGNTDGQPDVPATLSGSSPRGRGTPQGGASGDHRSRFIPAWAGNTRTATLCMARSPVHPRVGGEHRHPSVHMSFHNGSSPRGRGTRTGA